MKQAVKKPADEFSELEDMTDSQSSLASSPDRLFRKKFVDKEQESPEIEEEDEEDFLKLSPMELSKQFESITNNDYASREKSSDI